MTAVPPPPSSRFRSALLAGALTLWLSGGQAHVVGQEPEPSELHRPQAAGRIVRTFDFEERADASRPDFNPEPVPRHWTRAQHLPPERERPGFPLVNKAAYDLQQAHSGRVSVRLPTTGGSTALRLSGSLIPVFPSVDYAASAYVRTGSLRRARAFMTAQFLDEKGAPIGASMVRSEPVASPDDWMRVEIRLPGRFGNAAFVQLELQLLQPEQFNPAPLSAPHNVWEQDLVGDAWFDDITVVQLPRVDLFTSAAGNVLVGDQRLLLIADVRDLTGENMSAALTLRDINDQVVLQETRKLGAGGGRIDWSAKAPAFGWYRADLSVMSGGVEVGSAMTDLVWMPASADGKLGRGAASEAARKARSLFGLSLSPPSDLTLGLIPELVRKSGTGRVTIELPSAGDPVLSDPERLGELKSALERLLTDRIEVTLAVERVQDGLAQSLRIDPADPLALFEQDESKWMPSMHALFDLFGQRVQRWRMSGEASMASLLSPELPRRLGTLRRALSRAIPGPLISIPSRADWAWPTAAEGAPPAADGIAMTLPQGFGPMAIEQVGRQWAKQRGDRVELNIGIEAPKAETFGRFVSVTELMTRAALMWEAVDPWSSDPTRRTSLHIRDPWLPGPSRNSPVLPEPSLAVWRTLSEHLGPRRVAGRLPTPEGLTCLVLVDAAPRQDGRKTGALLVWSDRTETAETSLSAQVGQGPLVMVDPFGNTTGLTPGRNGVCSVPISSAPTFIEGIDAELAIFVQGLRLDPPFINATATEHEAEIILTNPWPTRLAGEIQLAPPPTSPVRRSWRFSPTAPIPFAINPGGQARLPITFSFSAAEESGAANLGAIVRLSSGQSLVPMVLSVPVTIGLPDLELLPGLLLSPTSVGPDVIVSASVTNSGTASRTLLLDALASGEASQLQPISNLLPGEMVIRRFIFKDAATRLAGRRVRISLSDAEGPERLNRSVMAPSAPRGSGRDPK